MDTSSRRTPIFPWQMPHACAEDRAMGLELELIELVRSRSLARDQGRSVDPYDRQIDQVTVDLAAIAAGSVTETAAC